MILSLNNNLEQLIAKHVQSGRFASPEEVVAAAMNALECDTMLSEFAPGELDRLIAEGEASGPPIDGEKFLSEWRALRSTGKAASP
jgi:putative addiction module CopG family antidote